MQVCCPMHRIPKMQLHLPFILLSTPCGRKCYVATRRTYLPTPYLCSAFCGENESWNSVKISFDSFDPMVTFLPISIGICSVPRQKRYTSMLHKMQLLRIHFIYTSLHRFTRPHRDTPQSPSPWQR